MKDAFYEKILNYDCMDIWVHDAKGSCSGTSIGKFITKEKVHREIKAKLLT